MTTRDIGGWVQASQNPWGGRWYRPISSPSAPATSAPAVTSAVTGVNPMETSYSLYGHPVPLLVLGRGRIGGEIISGPWISNGRGSGINSFGVQADPTRTLTLIEIAFDSEVVWEGSTVGNPSSYVTPDAAGFKVEAFTCRFYTGSLTQPADSLETTNFPGEAVAYRGQVLLAIENLPLANTKYGKYPYISCRVVDEDGEEVNFGEAFERLAYSPYVGFTSDEFETVGITDGVADGGFIITEDIDFLSLIQKFGRYYPTWDILQTDKLRIVDRGSDVNPDITLDGTRLMEKITVNRQGQDAVKKDLELSTIDPDADYTIVPFRAARPLVPVAVTSSVGVDSDYLPVIMDASTRAAITTLAQQHEENARETIPFTTMAFGLEIEPGTLVRFRELSEEWRSRTFKVIETLHGANYVVEGVAQAILKCQLSEEPPEFISTSDTVYVVNTSENQTIPTCEEGDLLLAVVMHRSALTPATGWTLVVGNLATSTPSPTGLHGLSICKRIAQSGDSGSSTTWTQATSQRMAVHIMAFRKDRGSPQVIDGDTGTLDNTAATSIAIPEVAATEDGQIGIAFATSAFAVNPDLTFTGMHLHMTGSVQTTPEDELDNRLCGGYVVMTAGDVTEGTISTDGAGAGNSYAAISLVIG